MKRSEMLEIISTAFMECLDIPNESYILNNNYDEYILSKIEEKGMLPPKACIEKVIRVGDEERVVYHNVHEWEKE